MKIIFYVFFLLLVILGATFAYLNAGAVTFNYYFGKHSMPLSLLLVCALGVGLLLGLLATLLPVLKLKAKNLGLKRKLKAAQQEVENLRSIPIKDSH